MIFADHNVSMRVLQDEHLLDCYVQAVELSLDPQFVGMLYEEIERRKLRIPVPAHQ